MDTGYPNKQEYLVPHSGTRYHKLQFECKTLNNAQEAFSRAHLSFQNYTERSFGVLKKR